MNQQCTATFASLIVFDSLLNSEFSLPIERHIGSCSCECLLQCLPEACGYCLLSVHVWLFGRWYMADICWGINETVPGANEAMSEVVKKFEGLTQ